MRSAIMMTVRLVLERTLVGMIDAYDDSQAVDPVDAPVRIDHRAFVVVGSHRCGARPGETSW
jgi:hypothetical protein